MRNVSKLITSVETCCHTDSIPVYPVKQAADPEQPNVFECDTTEDCKGAHSLVAPGLYSYSLL